MHHTLGHGQGPGADIDRQEPFALRVDRRPHPVARTLKALDGVVFTDLAALTPRSTAYNSSSCNWLHVHIAEEIG